MAKCGYCGTTILFGGVKAEDGTRYCKQECADGGVLVELSDRLPDDVVREAVRETFHGACPICGGEGPVDVANAYKVWSIVLMTSWGTDVHVCCRSCARKRQAGKAALSLVVGWWGFPWGLVMTPVQVGRNLIALFRPYPAEPSADLERIVRVALANQVVEQYHADQAADGGLPDAHLAPEVHDLPPESFDPAAYQGAVFDTPDFSRSGAIEPK